MSSTSPILDRSSGSRRRVVVVGGGICGLTVAHRLREIGETKRDPLEVTVLEGGKRFGGVIRTVRDGGHLLESGPDTLVSHKPAGVELCKRLGLADEIVSLDSTRHRPHLLHGERLISVPTGFKLVAPTKLGPVFRSPLFSTWGKIRIALERFVPPRSVAVAADESLAQFVERRFGRELVDRVAQPVMGSLFAADADELSLAATVPQLRSMERKHGSLTQAVKNASKAPSGNGGGRRPPAHGLVALRSGMQSLVDRLTEVLPDDGLLLDTKVVDLRRVAGGWSVETSDGRTLEADVVVLACPAHAGADVIENLDGSLAESMRNIQYADCATIHLVYRADQAHIPKASFGFFVPKAQAQEILACSFIHVKFPDRVADGRVVLRAFAGGALQPGVLGHDDAELVRRAHRALAGPLALQGEPEATRVFRHPAAMPQFAVGFLARRDWMMRRLDRHPGLITCGGVSGALGLPDSIASAEKAAEQVAEFVESIQHRATG